MIRFGANGTMYRIDVSENANDAKVLDQVQRGVGGYVEQVHVPGMPGLVLLCDEDGRAKGLPINPAASAIAGRPIVGNVVLAVLVPGDDEDGGLTWR